MERITIFLEPVEKNALLSLANKEYRDPRYQAALIIREELTRRGLLTPQGTDAASQVEPRSKEG